MSEPSKAVFMSYASQDAAAARRICDALRVAGIEVWFDQNELRGGDAWDRQIRKQIHDCALFIPIISANSQARLEGYFRLEWKLAVERTYLMSERVAFLVPVVIDDTGDAEADVPDSFRAMQWTRLTAGATPPAFVARISQLLSSSKSQAMAQERPSAKAAALAAHPSPDRIAAASRRLKLVSLLIGVIALMVGGYFALDKLVLSKRSVASLRGESAEIPEKSIAVLPFVNMSSDKEQDYFSDGLTEEMIDLLGRVPDLRVPARTSSFYFKGKNETIANIAQQLKVAHVLEGSVRKAGKRLRITAQLIRVDNGYHLWSQTYDRDDTDTDVFAIQDDIAKAVVSVMQVKLAGGAQDAGSRGTTSTGAYNQYLLGRQLHRRGSLEAYRQAIEAYGKAIALDPHYAAAYAGLGLAEAFISDLTGDTDGIERARHDVEMAIALGPADAMGYSARSYIRTAWLWDWSGAQADIEKALVLDPHNSDVHSRYASLLESLGRLPEAIAAEKKATELDPLSSSAWENLGHYYTELGDYAPAAAALGRALELEPTSVYTLDNLGTLYLLQSKDKEALEAFRKVDLEWLRLTGIAMTEHTLRDLKASQQALEDLIAKHAQEAAYQIAEVYAWRSEKDKAFEWLEQAYSQRDGGLAEIKADPSLKSLHADPRFRALLHKLKLPE